MEGHELEEEMIEIPPIYITFPQPSYETRLEDELESLRNKFNDVVINYLEESEEEDCDKDFKVKEKTHEMLPQLTTNTLDDAPTKFMRRLTEGE